MACVVFRGEVGSGLPCVPAWAWGVELLHVPKEGPWAFLPACPNMGQKEKVGSCRACVLSAVKHQNWS